MAAVFFIENDVSGLIRRTFTAADNVFKRVQAVPSGGGAVYKMYTRYGKRPVRYFVGLETEKLLISGYYSTEHTEGQSPFKLLYDWRDIGQTVVLIWPNSPVPFKPDVQSHREKYTITNLIETPGELFQAVPVESTFNLTLERVYD